jgi:hypothetical protein
MLFRLALLALVLSFALPTSARAAIIHFTVDLDAANSLASGEANPGATGSGTGTITLDTSTHMVTYDISFSGTQGTEIFSHLHGASAAPGTSPARYFLTNGSPKQGSVQLTDPVETNGAYTVAQQEADLIAGLWYVNIHTTHSMGGEIRGQIVVPEPGTLFFLASSALACASWRRRRG